MITLIRDFFKYLRHPQLVRMQDQIDDPYALLCRLTVLSICLALIAGVISHMLISFHLIPPPGPDLIDNRDIPYWLFTIGAVFLAPVLEELFFRAPLRRFSGMIFLLSFLAGLILSALSGTYWAFLFSPFLFMILFVVYRFTLAGSLSRKFRFWHQTFPWQFYLTALCFALVHLSNYEKGLALLPFGILYTLPQLSIGLLLGFTRMSYGLRYSILLHAAYNLVFAALLFSRY